MVGFCFFKGSATTLCIQTKRNQSAARASTSHRLCVESCSTPRSRRRDGSFCASSSAGVWCHHDACWCAGFAKQRRCAISRLVGSDVEEGAEAVMKTAREQLFDEVTGLLPSPPTDSSPNDMKKLMAKYRVQTKPGVEIGAGTTARDALGERLLDLWRAGSDDDATRTRMGTLIDEFRMQLKQSGPEGAPAGGPAVPRPAPRPRPTPATTALCSRAATPATSTTRASIAAGRPTSRPTKMIPMRRSRYACWVRPSAATEP